MTERQTAASGRGRREWAWPEELATGPAGLKLTATGRHNGRLVHRVLPRRRRSVTGSTEGFMAYAASDGDLITRLQRGDTRAVRDLETTFGSRIYQLAYRYLRSREDAEEVRQDVLLKVFRKIAAFRGEAALSSWIYRITFNVVMSRLRSGARRWADASGEGVDETPWGGARSAAGGPRRPRAAREPADWSALADEAVFREEFRRRLVQALTDLPEHYRTPVLLRDVHGLSTEEASALLRMKPQTLKSRLHRGRLILRAKLHAFATGLSLH